MGKMEQLGQRTNERAKLKSIGQTMGENRADSARGKKGGGIGEQASERTRIRKVSAYYTYTPRNVVTTLGRGGGLLFFNVRGKR